MIDCVFLLFSVRFPVILHMTHVVSAVASLMFWKGEGYDLNHNELVLWHQADLAFDSCSAKDLPYQFVYAQHALRAAVFSSEKMG